MNTNNRNTETGPVIEVVALHKRVAGPDGELVILDDINFVVPARQRVAICGVSGSGKSTLLNLLAGLDDPSSGEITILGENIGALDEDERARLRRDHIGFVFQSFHLVAGFSALENVMLPLELKRSKNVDELAREMLVRVGLEHRLQHLPNQLSGGEQQRVALARAFCGSPTILFADEPTGNLDQANAQQIVELLFSLNEEFGTTLVIVTHDHELAKRSDHQIVLAGGRLSD